MRYLTLLCLLFSVTASTQDLSFGLQVNDLTNHPMQAMSKPAYLDSYIDPSFGTTIRRITNASLGQGIVPMYSTVQAWNADESLMMLYDRSTNSHQLLNGTSYAYIRHMDDVDATDIEDLFWDFDEPDFLYYIDGNSFELIRYNAVTEAKQVLVNLQNITACSGAIDPGNDVQMMSWDNDVIGIRCEQESAYVYRISTGELTEINPASVGDIAPNTAPSGTVFMHQAEVFDASGSYDFTVNAQGYEHSCMGKMADGSDAYFAVAFQQGPISGDCIGDIIAHDLTTGDCFDIIGYDTGYGYPQSGVHISALAHKNTQGGWLCASMMGYDQDGQSLLDQELIIARADQGNIQVCRIGHHRSDEDDFDYWGEPHAVISPTGTRVLFGSDWSGAEDGQSLDSYVVELPSYVANVDCTLSASVLLQGPAMASGTMTTLLEVEGLLPMDQPFNTAPWNYTGSETRSATASNITDWLLLELRDPNDSDVLYSSAAALLKSDGSIVAMDGNSDLCMDNVDTSTDYQLIVRSRNHLAIASSNTIGFPQTVPYDLTQASNVLGGNTQVVSLANGDYAMYAGDFNSDGIVSLADYNVYIGDTSAILTYLDNDLNLDGQVSVSDFNLYKSNSSLIGVSAVRLD